MTTKMSSYKNKMEQRSGISQIMSSLLMLAIVATVGTVFLLQGMESIETFSSFVDFYKEGQTKSSQENIIIEHVTFFPNNKTISFWIRNNGVIDVTVDRISVVKIDTQDLITNNASMTKDVFVEEVKEVKISPSTIFSSASPEKWDSNYVSTSNRLNSSDYSISITTSRGNSFTTIARPFNT